MALTGLEVDAIARSGHYRLRADGERDLPAHHHPNLTVRVGVRAVRHAGIVLPLRHDHAFGAKQRDDIACRSGDRRHADRVRWPRMRSPRPPLEPLLASPQKALKEWAVVCAALADGRQSVLLRKGGIIEETRDFALVERSFLLYPTYEHQDEESVQERYRGTFRATLELQPPDDIVRITAWAEVTDLFLTHDLEALLALSGHYAWSADYVRMRMAYKPRKPMNVVCIRTHLLPDPVDVPVEEHFAGCKSWVPLLRPVALDGSTAAIADDEHTRRVEAVRSVLGVEPVAV